MLQAIVIIIHLNNLHSHFRRGFHPTSGCAEVHNLSCFSEGVFLLWVVVFNSLRFQQMLSSFSSANMELGKMTGDAGSAHTELHTQKTH